MIRVLIFLIFFFIISIPAASHEIYEGVHGADGQLCCGKNDCFATHYEEQNGKFFFILKPEDGSIKIEIPESIITWLPVPGDNIVDDPKRAHLCYRHVLDSDFEQESYRGKIINNTWLVYCAFIPPSGY